MRRRRPLARALATAALAAGCAGMEAGETPPAIPFAVASGGSHGLTLDAAGRAIVIAVPAGMCLSEADVHLRETAAVATPESCDAINDRLRRVVTIAAAPLVEDGGLTAAIDGMAARLSEPGGWRALGFGGDGGLRVLAVRRTPDALLAVVEDVDGPGAAPLGRRCRAVTEINGRLAVVTVASPPEDAASAETLFAETEAMLATLRAANGDASAARRAPPPAGPDIPSAPPTPTARPIA